MASMFEGTTSGCRGKSDTRMTERPLGETCWLPEALKLRWLAK